MKSLISARFRHQIKTWLNLTIPRLVSGDERWENILVRLLDQHYQHRLQRDWLSAAEAPHFFDHRIGMFNFIFTDSARGPYPYARGFFSAEVLRDGDTLLDIGCGDGFFARRFFAERCAHIDALDIEPDAIKTARLHNSAPNISYHLIDAVAQPFPASDYNVIVWDGALGHFSRDSTLKMLEKISHALVTEGVFTGSESLELPEEQSADHLQVFPTLADLSQLFRPHFKYIQLRELQYRIGQKTTTVRREGFWRCANSVERLRDAAWQDFS